jgi:transposase
MRVLSVRLGLVRRARVRELERVLGRKTMEVEILKEAIAIAREKKLLLRKPLSKEDDIP